MKPIIRKRYDYQNKNEPLVIVQKGRFEFNRMASSLARLSEYVRVIYYVDIEERKIGFQFTQDADARDSYKLCSNSKKEKFWCWSSMDKNYSWIGAVTQFSDIGDRSFKFQNDPPYWIIQLCPAFENSVTDISKIGNGIKGIYRYLNREEKIIYIGRGNIRSRHQEEERRNWGIWKIQYSIVEELEQQKYWEGHWIRKYQIDHNGQLPPFNHNQGG